MILLKLSNLKLLSELTILNSKSDKNKLEGDFLFKKDKNRLKAMFDYSNDLPMKIILIERDKHDFTQISINVSNIQGWPCHIF